MTQASLIARADTYAEEANPARTHGADTPLQVAGTAGSQRMAYLSIPIALPAGASVIAATLYLRTAQTTSTVVDLRVRKVTASWAEGKLNWNNRPATTATDEAVLSVAAGGDLRTLAVPITALVQGIVNAGQYYGLRLATPTSGQILRIRSSEATDPSYRPFVVIDYAVQPPAPIGLEPNGQLVSTPTPVLRWSVPGGSQVSYQVQIDDAADFATPTVDTGVVSSIDPQHLVATALPAALRYWRVRITDAAGQTSPWSDVATVTYAAPPTVTLTAPAATTTLLRPVVSWTYAGTYPQESFELAVFDAVTGDLVQNVPRAVSTATSFELDPLPHLGAYQIRLRVWDDADRAGGGTGAFPYVEITRAVTQAEGAGAAPTAVNADPVLPLVVLTWAGPGAGGTAIYRNGAYVATAAAGVTTYRDWGGIPGAQYKLRALDAGGNLGLAGTDTLDPNDVPLGVWLVYPDGDLAVQILDTAAGDWQVGESAATVVPLGGAPLRVTQNLRGYEGTIGGIIHPGAASGSATPTGRQQRADLYTIKQASSTGAIVRLAAAQENFPILIGALTIPPHPTLFDVYAVDLEYAQVGEFPMIQAESAIVRQGF